MCTSHEAESSLVALTRCWMVLQGKYQVLPRTCRLYREVVSLGTCRYLGWQNVVHLPYAPNDMPTMLKLLGCVDSIGWMTSWLACTCHIGLAPPAPAPLLASSEPGSNERCQSASRRAYIRTVFSPSTCLGNETFLFFRQRQVVQFTFCLLERLKAATKCPTNIRRAQ